jgi:hypothetical protein
MTLSNVLVTGGALLPLSESRGVHPTLASSGPVVERIITRVLECPLPQDWVGFVRQAHHQRAGGPSYLFGERRMTGWWYYYFVCLAFKAPIGLWMLASARAWISRSSAGGVGDRLILLTIAAFLAIVSIGSSRNYGIRYLLPVAPLAIVWISGLAEVGPWSRRVAVVGLAAMGLAVASAHPHELSYFNALAGGTRGGRHLLADSNLDWGQGAKPLAKFQREHPEYLDLTTYYFGDTDPGYYGVAGTRYVVDAGSNHPALPATLSATTRYVAVSTSLQFGPWGPSRYFDALKGTAPVRILDDGTIAIYRAAAIGGSQAPLAEPVRQD